MAASTPAPSAVHSGWALLRSQILNLSRAHRDLVFVLLWFAATFVGGLLYALPVGLVQIALGLDRVPPEQMPQLDLARLLPGAVLCGAACGSTIGLMQWLVLRWRVKRTGWWIVATIGGYASVALLSPLAALLQPRWLPWALNLVVNGKLHWLAREAVPPSGLDWLDAAWRNAYWPAGAITLTLFGAVLGLAQWLVLRGRVRHAGWWVAISTASYILLALLSTSAVSWPDFVTASWIVPVLASGIGLAWLLRGDDAARESIPRGGP